MNFNLVTVEIQSYITVANIEAESPEHAVAIATDLIDQKILIDRPARPYRIDMSPGTITSIESADVASAGAVTVYDESNEPTHLSYEVTADGNISRANIPTRIDVIEAARTALVFLEKAFENSTDDLAKEGISQAYNTLINAGVDNRPYQTTFDNHSNDNEDEQIDIDSEQEDGNESLHSKIIRVCFLDNQLETYRLEAPIFVSESKQKEDQDSEELTRWSIDFGEISIYQGEKKVGAIGTWKTFAAQDMVYFDDEDDFESAKVAILEANGIQRVTTEKPNLPGSLTATFSMVPSTHDQPEDSSSIPIPQIDG